MDWNDLMKGHSRALKWKLNRHFVHLKYIWKRRLKVVYPNNKRVHFSASELRTHPSFDLWLRFLPLSLFSINAEKNWLCCVAAVFLWETGHWSSACDLCLYERLCTGGRVAHISSAGYLSSAAVLLRFLRCCQWWHGCLVKPAITLQRWKHAQQQK